jgi:hypothetical protein
MSRIGLSDRWAYRLADRKDACWGLGPSDLDRLYGSSDLLLNIVGATDLREEHLAAPFRVYVETDPVIAELQLASGDVHTREALEAHHLLATYGENYGNADCGVPLDGLGDRYVKTRQPVDLELWPAVHEPSAPFFTTIGNYRQEGNDLEFRGEVYRWSKHVEWERFADLPSRTRQEFLLAMSPDDEGDRRLLESNGWRLTPPLEMSLDVFGAYPRFIQGSRAEFTVAKDQNVRLRSGWFSERDACYLASGKPVVAQDTGFGNVLPTGEGLFAFSTVDEAVSAVEEINADYDRHCKAARTIAEDRFDAPQVAAQLLRDIGMG